MIPGFEAEVEVETRQELGLSAMAAMMAEPSPTGLEMFWVSVYISVSILISQMFFSTQRLFLCFLFLVLVLM